MSDASSESTPLLVAFAGQSNMVGHSAAIDGEKPVNRKVLAWNNAGENGRWVTAQLGQSPFNLAPGQPNNLALHFADHLQRRIGRPIYLVGRPVNAATLLSWSRLSSPNMARLVRELEYALASSELQAAGVSHVDCLLWSQGESDDVEATMVKDPKVATLNEYSAEIRSMMKELGSRPWWRPPRSKFIASELVSNGWLAARNDFYGDAAQWQSIAGMGVARSEGLTHVGDRAHFSGASLQMMGERMFAVWCQLEGQAAR